MNAEPPERWPRMRHLASLVFIVAPTWALAQPDSGDMLTTNIPSYLGVTIALMILVIAINGLFVAADTSIELLRLAHVKMFENGRATKLQQLLDHRPHYVAACTLGSQTCRAWMMILSFMPAPYLAHAYAEQNRVPEQWWYVLMAGVAVTIPVAAVNVVFGELVPKSYSALHPHRVALRTFGLIRATALILTIPSKVLTGVANLITRRFGATASFSFPNQAEQEIRSLVESAEETGEIESEEKELLHSVFEFTDTVSREVMTPRVDVDAAPIQSSVEELIQLIQDSGHSRIPIYEETDDQIIGIVHAKDLMIAQLRSNGTAINLRTLLRPAMFVPENKDLYDLLREMRLHRTQMAIVQDEFGGTAGIVTIEDIVEELVGDIVDEYDTEEKEIESDADGWTVQGRTNIYDLNDAIGASFDTDEFDTLGGYVFGQFGRQPKEGETLEHSGYKFTVLETDGRRISKIRVERDNSLQTALDEMMG